MKKNSLRVSGSLLASLALCTVLALLAPTLPPLAPQAQAQSDAVDPESGKRADEAGIESDEPARGELAGQSKLPLPRFASLRASEVNLRTGPGVRYPVDWVYKRRGLPIEIVAEFGTWRKIRDDQGTEGWVHRQMLQGRRTVLIAGKEQVLRRSAEPSAAAVVRLSGGVIAQVMECEGEWCRVEAAGFRGWLPRAGTWGTKPGERIR